MKSPKTIVMMTMVRTMKGRIERIAYIGWRGIDYEEVQLDQGAFTGLIGPSGAGKSTLVMCLDYALLPDRKALDIRPISELQDPHTVGTDSLATRINPDYGYAYVALDLLTRHGTRVLVGIHVRLEDGRSDLTRWYIDNVPSGTRLQDVFRVVEDEEQHYPDFHDLRRSLAREGIDMHVCRTVGDYGQVLYDAGVLPTNLSDGADRTLYGKLIETTFRGGISAEVATKLKDYLLPEERRIPQTVSKLQECTNQVFTTRRALGDANQQLSLLLASYGTGKTIVLHALRYQADRVDGKKRSLEAIRQDIQSAELTIGEQRQSVTGMAQEIQIAETTIQTLQQSAKQELATLETLVGTQFTDRTAKEGALKGAKDACDTLRKGHKAWRDAAKNHEGRDPEWLDNWLDGETNRLNLESTKNALEIERLQAEIANLDGGSTNPKSATLARALGGQTLEEVFDGVADVEARALEMSLCGLLDGVVGVTPDALRDLEDTEAVPQMFWLGEHASRPATVREIGAWYVASGAGGYVVSSKGRKSVFGRQARQDRIGVIRSDITRLQRRQGEIETGKGNLKERQKTLLTDSDAIGFFFTNRSRALELENAQKSAKEACDKAIVAHVATEKKVQELRERLFDVAKLHHDALVILKARKERAQAETDRLTAELPGKLALRKGTEGELLVEEQNLAGALEALGIRRAALMAEVSGVGSESVESYSVLQTRRIDSLGAALKDELPARLALVQEANPLDVLSCARLWPMLLDVLRDRIALDVADTDGADLIESMQRTRDDLNERLSLQEGEVKIQARSLHAAIHSAVVSQKTRIQSLSRLGENIKFGNVTGIRIKVETYKDMLSLLESFADQMSLDFSDTTKPVDEALHEFFRIGEEKLKFTGEQLLDYRTYMDLVIEVQRAGGKWESAASLSGGESIGGGLAIALMLSRAMASRGEIKADQITPLFAIDEVHRLDAKGQEVIVEFAKREGFQVFVTASALSPNYECTLYTLHRSYNPEECLTIRGTQKKSRPALSLL